MPTECILPDLGENIESGTVVEVLVAVGDTIALEQPLLILETDKAEFELPSTVAGIVAELRVAAGDDVNVGQVILTVDGADAMASTSTPVAEEPATATQAKPAPAEAAPAAAPEQPAEAKPSPPPAKPASAPEPPRSGKPIPAAPSVRRLARELGVDLHQVQGTGPRGRISEVDVRAYTQDVMSTLGKGAGPATISAAPLPDFAKWGPVERVAMSKVRVRTAQNMTRSWAAPHVTQVDKADITELEAQRKRYARRVEAAGGKLTMTAILTRVAAAALKKFPQFNASLDLLNDEIVYKQYINIGIAADTERGLLVPVVKDADKKSIRTLAVEIQELAEKARNRNIRPDMMQGGTFTITNLGGIGGTSFTPIINAPEVAILGVSRARMEPVYQDGAFVPRLMLPLSLSYDHRAIDGADAARFTRWVCEALEQPFLLLLEDE